MRYDRSLCSAIDGKIPPMQKNNSEQLKILLANRETSTKVEDSHKNSPLKSNSTNHKMKVPAVYDRKASRHV